MSDKLSSANHLSVKASRTIDPALIEGSRIKQRARIVVAVSRPSGLRGVSRDKSGQHEIFYDGKQFVVWNKGSNTYATVSAPATLDKTIDAMEEKWGTHPPLADLLVSDPYTSLMERVESGKLVGSASVGGTSCHHLAFTQAEVDWQIWIGKNDQLPRRFVITFTGTEGKPEIRADIQSWDLNTTYSADYFKPMVGKGAVKVEMIPTN